MGVEMQWPHSFLTHTPQPLPTFIGMVLVHYEAFYEFSNVVNGELLPPNTAKSLQSNILIWSNKTVWQPIIVDNKEEYAVFLVCERFPFVTLKCVSSCRDRDVFSRRNVM